MSATCTSLDFREIESEHDETWILMDRDENTAYTADDHFRNIYQKLSGSWSFAIEGYMFRNVLQCVDSSINGMYIELQIPKESYISRLDNDSTQQEHHDKILG